MWWYLNIEKSIL